MNTTSGRGYNPHIMTEHDRQLGMGSPISRRDFLNGVAIGVGGTIAAGWLSPDLETLLAQGQAGSYPPALTGLRGSHAGSFEAFHSMRDDAFWKNAPAPEDTGEEYDLVVVGGGISGLTAAHVFRKARPDARVLVLDNHDDFGGHAKRNEFTHNGRTYIGYGGTQSIDSPAPYSKVAKDLISELGIEVSRYPKVLDSDLYKSLGLRPAFFFDKETFGTDRLLAGDIRDDAFLAAAPVSDAVRRDHKRLLTERFDPMPGLSQSEKKARLARMSYADFLTKMWKLDPGVLPLYQTRPHGLFGVGIDAVPAQDAFGFGYPGFGAMGMDSTPGPGQNFDSIRSKEAEDYYFHFPDGNASVARLLVRSARARRPPRLDDGRHRDGAGRLRQARRRRSAGENPREQLRDARAAHRAGRPRPARRSGVPAQRHQGPQDGQGAFGRPGVLALDHSVPVSRAARRAEDGARVRHQGAARLHERVHPIVEGLSEAGRPAHLDSGDVAHLGGPGFPGEPRRLQVPDRSGRTHRAAPVEGGVPSGPAGARPTPRGPG